MPVTRDHDKSENSMDSAPLAIQGLNAAQVEESRQKFGANVLTPPPRDPWWKLFLEKFEDPIIRILLIAAAIAVGVGLLEGNYAEGVGIIVAILLATTMAFLNEYRAKKEFDILSKVNDQVKVEVIRDGHYMEIPKCDVVVGDFVLVKQGEEVPADGELAEAMSLEVDESRLTGESEPAEKVAVGEKAAAEISLTAFPAENLYRGSLVAEGHGVMKVTAVGDQTEIGKTARLSMEVTNEKTPLTQQLERLSKLIGVVGFGVAGSLFVALIVRDYAKNELVLTPAQWRFSAILALSALIAMARVWMPIFFDLLGFLGRKGNPPAWLEKQGLAGWVTAFAAGAAVFAAGVLLGRAADLIPAAPSEWLSPSAGQEFLKFFMIAITVIVVAVPEGLAMSVTLSLAYSMRKMTATNNLVRRMHACETIGAATVICTDKTGTLTTSRMRIFDTQIPCLNAEGAVEYQGLPLDPKRLLFEALSANTTANIGRTPGEPPTPIGNPTECALLMWMEDQGVNYLDHRTNFRVNRRWTFSTERKFMATLGISETYPAPLLHLKGAPEVLLRRCGTVLTEKGVRPIDDYRAEILDLLKSYQSRGMRTLGFALQKVDPAHMDQEIEVMAGEMTWLGLAAIADPIRSDVPQAMEACKRAGINVKIVTGDTRDTAVEIARQSGLWDAQSTPDQHVVGHDFELLDDAAVIGMMNPLKIMSRAKSQHKMRLVKLLRDQGHVVAVTGDGVNDGPALNYANVGLAMGSGTDVAREASDIVLLDDSFASIVNAIMWGRSLYQNIQRFILFQLTINVAALGVALLGPFIGVELPLTVTQMLWVNLIMDTFAALALAAEPPHWDVMKRPPRDPKAFIVTPAMGRNILMTGGAFLVPMIAFLLYAPKAYPSAQEAGEVSVHGLTVFFTMFVMLQFWNLFNARCLGLQQSAFTHLWANRGMVYVAGLILAGQWAIVQFGGEFFRTDPLSFKEWALILVGTSFVLWVGEISRFLQRRPGKTL